jgi:hypothetical protein
VLLTSHPDYIRWYQISCAIIDAKRDISFEKKQFQSPFIGYFVHSTATFVQPQDIKNHFPNPLGPAFQLKLEFERSLLMSSIPKQNRHFRSLRLSLTLLGSVAWAMNTVENF